MQESGIFDALQRGFLESLCLSICENAEHPDEILEFWTLTIHYMDGNSSRERVACSLAVKEQRGTSITIHDAKSSLNDFIRKLNDFCMILPELPAEKNIVLQVTYTDERPESYFAPGFPHPVYSPAGFSSDDLQDKVTSDVASMLTSYHAGSLQVSHLRNVITAHDSSPPRVSPRAEETERGRRGYVRCGRAVQSVCEPASQVE